MLEGDNRGRRYPRGNVWRSRSQRVQSGTETKGSCESCGGDLARHAGDGGGSCSQMIWTGRDRCGAEGDLYALQAPEVLLVPGLCAIEEIGQWDMEMGGESWPVRPAVVCGARTGDDIPEHFLLVLAPLDLGVGCLTHARRVDRTLTFGGSGRESSGRLSGSLTTTLTFNGAMRAIPKAGRGWKGDGLPDMASATSQ